MGVALEKSELVLTTPFGQVSGIEWRNEQADCKTPCILLHGWLDNAASFDHLVPSLNCTRVFALDHYGHGKSDHKRDPGFYSTIDYVLFCHAAADALGLQQFCVIGHSLGAIVASLWALSDTRIEKMVWLDAVGSISSPSAHRPESIRTAIHQFFNIRPGTVYDSLQTAAEVRAGVDELLSLEAAHTLVERNMKSGPDGYRWRYDARLRLPTPIRMNEEDVLVCLTAVSQPLLILLAEQGWPAMNREQLKYRLQQLPDASIQWLAGGHHFHMNPIANGLPEAINRFLLEV